MKREILITIGITFLFLGTCITPTIAIDNVNNSSMPISNGNTLYVGGTGEGNYTMIQDAIDNASDGDTVFVYNGTYYENVVIYKSINLIGEDENNTVIHGNNYGDVVDIIADRVYLSGFYILNSGLEYYDSGIQIKSNYSVIKGNRISFNEFGIYIFDSQKVHISENEISVNRDGLELHYSSNNNISGNNIFFNKEDGIILLIPSCNNIIINNNISFNLDTGIRLYDNGINFITGNIIKSNLHDGIIIASNSNENTIMYNSICWNNWTGIHLFRSDKNKIMKNNFVNNDYQAYFEFCRNKWKNNYWNKPRLLPKFIFGKKEIGDKKISWINVDWHPAKEPYDIEVP